MMGQLNDSFSDQQSEDKKQEVNPYLSEDQSDVEEEQPKSEQRESIEKQGRMNLFENKSNSEWQNERSVDLSSSIIEQKQSLVVKEEPEEEEVP